MVRSEEQKRGKSMDTFYEEDILGEGFQRATISLCDDYEGRAIATLVRRLSDKGNGRSVLYIHGFNDYFFQREMACRLNERSRDFIFTRWIYENTGVRGCLIRNLMTSGIFGLILRRLHSLCK